MDQELGDRLSAEFAFEEENADYYNQDNTIELQLPFIKYTFPNAKLLTMGVPPKANTLKIGERTAEIAEELGRRIVVIGSTDLTHYGPNYDFVDHGVGGKALKWVKEENDKQMVELMEAMDAKEMIHESQLSFNACCGGAAAAAVSACKRLGAENGETIIYKTSYDIRPDNSFVGYAGVVFS